ncbi:DUF2321 domain-containing protein [Companilactobacillus nantensis]|uniref:DUF2321 domain-containing protein n=1 Tax=Companilactobacillus nantensis TaxID=305793 RepID=UPI00070BC02C|nr:DUF2321 domain-containing protein [Companilactobacillus nantensis]GEO64431.1 hypothetical protein LNA01_16140 [Companilactobacillus nantensis]
MTQRYQKICKNGHQLSVTYRGTSDPTEFCPECGKSVISTCQFCHAPIEGWDEPDGIVYLGQRTADRPNYCKKCGQPYPWTSLIISTVIELLDLDEEVSDQDKTLIKSAIPDLLVDTPQTKLAEAKFKKGFSKVSILVKDSLYNLLVDVLSDTVKKSIFPN